MANKNYREDLKHRSPVDPKKFRRGAAMLPETTKMHGSKEMTDTGYKTAVHLGKKFDSFCQTVVEGNATDISYHPKKTRTIRVINGLGYLTEIENPKDVESSWVTEQKTLVPGDIIECAPGKGYRIATGSSLIEFVVTQELNFDKDVVSVSPAITTGDLEDHVHEVERSDIIEGFKPASVRTSSRAIENLMKRADVVEARRANIPVNAEKTLNKDPRAEFAAMLSEDAGF